MANNDSYNRERRSLRLASTREQQPTRADTQPQSSRHTAPSSTPTGASTPKSSSRRNIRLASTTSQQSHSAAHNTSSRNEAHDRSQNARERSSYRHSNHRMQTDDSPTSTRRLSNRYATWHREQMPRSSRSTALLLIGTLLLAGIAVALLSLIIGTPTIHMGTSDDSLINTNQDTSDTALASSTNTSNSLISDSLALIEQASTTADSTVSLGNGLAAGILRSYSPGDFDAIPQSSSPITFTLVSNTGDSRSDENNATALTGEDAPVLTTSTLTQLESAIDAVRAECDPIETSSSNSSDIPGVSTSDLSLVALDLTTGNGVALNPTGTVYGASSIKGPYALYVCEQQIETGTVDLSAVSDLLTNSIVWSDNDSFFSLRDWFDSGWNDWVTNLGVDDMPLDSNSDFSWYSPISAIKIWNEAAHYLATNSETAIALAELYSKTDTSFLRQALGSTGSVVFDKAGWIASGINYDALVDNGIVERGGHIYLVSIMSSLSDTDAHRELFVSLADAVMDAVIELS